MKTRYTESFARLSFISQCSNSTSIHIVPLQVSSDSITGRKFLTFFFVRNTATPIQPDHITHNNHRPSPTPAQPQQNLSPPTPDYYPAAHPRSRQPSAHQILLPTLSPERTDHSSQKPKTSATWKSARAQLACSTDRTALRLESFA